MNGHWKLIAYFSTVIILADKIPSPIAEPNMDMDHIHYHIDYDHCPLTKAISFTDIKVSLIVTFHLKRTHGRATLIASYQI